MLINQMKLNIAKRQPVANGSSDVTVQEGAFLSLGYVMAKQIATTVQMNMCCRDVPSITAMRISSGTY